MVMAPPSDTPPASPGIEGDEGDMGEVTEQEAIEVIDLDEELGGLDDDDGEPQEDEVEGAGSMDHEEEAPEDNCDFLFKKHGKESVFACDLFKKSDKCICATGGQDDTLYVWDGSDGSIMFQSTFADSVVHVRFNSDGSLLAAADMIGNIRVWRTTNGNSKEPLISFETGEVTWLDWHPGANVLFAGTDDSILWMWKVPSGVSKVFPGHGAKIECAKVLHDGKRCIVAYNDGELRLFDLKSGDQLHHITGHKESVNALDVRADNVLVASGSTDGMAKIFNTQTGKNIANMIGGPIKDSTEEGATTASSVETVLFSDQASNQLITGTLEGVLTVWDVSTTLARHRSTLSSGISKTEWRKGTDNQLLVATLDGSVRVFDTKSYTDVGDCSGHTQAILDFGQSADGNKIVTASDDGNCRLFDLNKIVVAK